LVVGNTYSTLQALENFRSPASQAMPPLSTSGEGIGGQETLPFGIESSAETTYSALLDVLPKLSEGVPFLNAVPIAIGIG